MFSPKDKIGDWLESYVEAMEVPYWTGTAVTRASWSEQAQEWTVQVERDGDPLTLRPRHLVLATGLSGRPNVPDLPARTCSGATSTTPRPTPGPRRGPGSAAW